MLLFKNTADTLEQVIANNKHASDSFPSKVKYGDIILISQTYNTLKKGEKSIRYIMHYGETYEDLNDESVKLWNKKWKYIISGYNIQAVEPFNLKDIQVSKHNYETVMTHCFLLEEDEEAVLNWIFTDEIISDNDTGIYELEFNKSTINDKQLLEGVDKKFMDIPNYKEKIVRYLHRPSCIRNTIIKIKGTKCQICRIEGFQKKNSTENYCEVHHMIELNKNAPKTLQSWNLIVVCPTCHKRLHYGDVSSKLNNDNRWEISFEGNPYKLL